jgi:uncharacterized repeat protein (TIGR03847 family)
MNQPEWIELSRADFITVDAVGLPGQRVFYLQAAQGDLVVTLIIEKEQAAAIAVAVSGALQQLNVTFEEEADFAGLDLITPVEPLFRVGQLELGYDQERDMLVIAAEELTEEEGQGDRVRIWARHEQMAALARKAAVVVASGRPICPLCDEVIEPDEEHVCVRDNGRKRLYELEED